MEYSRPISFEPPETMGPYEVRRFFVERGFEPAERTGGFYPNGASVSETYRLNGHEVTAHVRGVGDPESVRFRATSIMLEGNADLGEFVRELSR